MFESPEALRDAVMENGGVLTVRVGDVRDAFKYGRLGVHVRSDISKRLNGLGIAHTRRRFRIGRSGRSVCTGWGRPSRI